MQFTPNSLLSAYIWRIQYVMIFTAQVPVWRIEHDKILRHLVKFRHTRNNFYRRLRYKTYNLQHNITSTYTLLNYEFETSINKMLSYITHLQYSTYATYDITYLQNLAKPTCKTYLQNLFYLWILCFHT